MAGRSCCLNSSMTVALPGKREKGNGKRERAQRTQQEGGKGLQRKCEASGVHGVDAHTQKLVLRAAELILGQLLRSSFGGASLWHLLSLSAAAALHGERRHANWRCATQQYNLQHRVVLRATCTAHNNGMSYRLLHRRSDQVLVVGGGGTSIVGSACGFGHSLAHGMGPDLHGPKD
jgi:hypothetical protein